MRDRDNLQIEHAPSLREMTFTYLARHWAETLERNEGSIDWVITSEYMRNLSGACLVLLGEYSCDFGEEALQAASYNEKLSASSDNLSWLIAMPWRICIRSISSEDQYPDVFHESVYPGLEHPNSIYRGYVIALAWLIKGQLDKELASEAMLDNFAKTLNFVEEAWALGARLYLYEEDEFYAIAEKWNPATFNEKINGAPSPFLGQYQERLLKIKEMGLTKASASLTAYERDCYEVVASTALFISEPIE